MPTIHDAFSPASSAFAAPVDSDDPVFDRLPPFEALAAVVLGRSLGLITAHSVLDVLREAGWLDPEHLAGADLVTLRQELSQEKSARAIKVLPILKHLAGWVLEKKDAGAWSDEESPPLTPSADVDSVRSDLARIKGLGRASADAVILLALRMPAYPVDRASYRILVRHGWLDSTATYEEASETLAYAANRRADGLGADPVRVLTDVANRLEQTGRIYCRASTPRCDGCPFQSYLPDGGPRGDHG